jgi:hypothetical protein
MPAWYRQVAYYRCSQRRGEMIVNRPRLAIALCLFALVAFSAVGPASGFSDVPKWHWAWRYIEGARDAGIVQGYWDGYRPDEAVTRAQMAVYVARAVAGEDANVPTGPAEATFPDVPDADPGPAHWAYKYVEYAHSQNIVFGYWDGYRPDEVVNRAQMAVFIARAVVAPTGDAAIPDPEPPATFPDVPPTHWAWKWVEYCYDQGIVQGYWDGYHPDEAVNRAQMAVYVCRAFGLPMPPQPYNITEYFPLAESDEWTYQDEGCVYTQAVVGNGSMCDQPCILVALSAPYEGYANGWQTAADGLRHPGYDNPYPPDEGLVCFSPPLYFANGLEVGDGDTQAVNGGDVVFSYEFLGVESVTVPAGTFEDCMKLEIHIESGGHDDAFHLWLAKGVGSVKRDERPLGGDEWEELISATVGGVHYPSADEQAIRDAYAAMATALEVEDLDALMDHFSAAFLHDGKDALWYRDKIAEWLASVGNVEASWTATSVAIAGACATADSILMACGDPVEGGSPEYGRLSDTDYWLKEDGVWRLYGNQQRAGTSVETKYYAEFPDFPCQYALRVRAWAAPGDASAVDISGPDYIATAWVMEGGGDPSRLYDDGLHGDNAAGDGYWKALMGLTGGATPQVGDIVTYQITYADASSEERQDSVSAVYSQAATLVSPQDGATVTSLAPTFTWLDAPIPGLIYQIEVSLPDFTEVYTSGGALEGTGACTMPSGYLASATQYIWKVAGDDADGNTVVSEIRTFFTP